MNKVTLALASAGVLLSVPALAADLGRPVYKAPVIAAVPTFNWSGCYIGVSGGGAWGQSRHINRAGGVDTNITNDYDLRGGLVGPTVGCNFQTGAFVFGVEGDWSWTSKEGSAFDIPPFNVAFESQTREHWLATARGRVGWAWDRWMIYVTGGAAFADIEARVIPPAPPLVTISESRTRVGWTVGAGWEWAFSQNWSAKLEYLYVDFGNEAYFQVPPAGFVNRAGGVPVTDHIIRAGINYRFNWAAPLVASY
jgi:outer membrane immunogenic protein